MANKKQEFCFICGKKESEVNRLFTGTYGGCICDECVQEAYWMLDGEEEEGAVKIKSAFDCVGV